MRNDWPEIIVGALVILAVLFFVVAVGGCASPQTRYKPVPIVVTKYRPVPAKWLKICPKAEPRDNTGLEVLRVASARGACVDKLNGQLKAIKSVMPHNTQN